MKKENKINILTAFFSSIIMSVVLSLVMTLINVGFNDHTLIAFLGSLAIAFPTAFLLALFIPKLIIGKLSKVIK